jgi:hypothetical protein
MLLVFPVHGYAITKNEVELVRNVELRLGIEGVGRDFVGGYADPGRRASHHET